MKKIAVLQPFYLPWMGVFNQIASVDVFVIGDDFLFTKNSWINRNRIKNPNGGFIWLTVPVKNKNILKKDIKDVEIDYTHRWQKKHTQSIKHIYRKSIFFDEYYPGIEKILLSNYVTVFEMNLALLRYFLNILKISTEIKFRSSYDCKSMDKNYSLLEICKAENAKTYLTGPSARNYINKSIFKKNKISIEFQKYSHCKYFQKGSDYVDKLSILDAFFMLGPEKTRKIIYSI